MIDNGIEASAAEEQAEQEVNQAEQVSPAEPAYVNRDELGSILDEVINRWGEDIDRRFAQMRQEGERLARMSPGERDEYERERLKQDLESSRADIMKREGEIVRRELRADALKKLGEMGLPNELADVVDCSGKEACDKSIAALDRAFRAAVRAGIDERLKHSRVDVFRNPAHVDTESLSDEDFYRLRLSK